MADDIDIIHNRSAGNCIYQSAKASDLEVCPMPQCMANYNPPEDVTDTADLIDPAKFEQRFEEEREETRARFSTPQVVQTVVPTLESLSEDFEKLAKRINVEVTEPRERDEATRHLELSFLLVVRGLTYG